MTDPVLAGQPTVTVDTTDKGAGVFVARILVDGQVRASTPFGDKLCRDIDTSQRRSVRVLDDQPVPAARHRERAARHERDRRRRLPPVQVQVIDAAGNATTIADRTVGISRPTLPGFFDPASRHFLNPWLDLAAARQLNGQGASSGAILRVYLPVRRTERFKHGRYKGQRRRVVRAAATEPCASLHVRRSGRADRRRAPADRRRQRMDCVARRGRGVADHGPAAHDGQDRACRTTAAGTHTLAPDQRRLLPVQRQPRAGSWTTGEAQGPRRSDPRGQPPQRPNGQRVRFRGHVAGPIAPGGATASLQVKLGRRYRTFRALRVTSIGGGRFDTSYRFTSTSHATRYRFRVLVSQQAGLPYERGTSSVASVVVRP